MRPKPATPDIEAVLEHYGVAAGRKRVVLCPIHGDSTPSCSINYERNLFNCHACGKGGDSWTLIMEKEGLDFGGAIDFATSVGFTDGAAGGGRQQVRGSRYGSGGAVSDRSRNLAGNRAYKPSWRRG